MHFKTIALSALYVVPAIAGCYSSGQTWGTVANVDTLTNTFAEVCVEFAGVFRNVTQDANADGGTKKEKCVNVNGHSINFGAFFGHPDPSHKERELSADTCRRNFKGLTDFCYRGGDYTTIDNIIIKGDPNQDACP